MDVEREEREAYFTWSECGDYIADFLGRLAWCVDCHCDCSDIEKIEMMKM
jgi:hypothetical protein